MKLNFLKDTIKESKIKLREKKFGELLDNMLNKGLEIHSSKDEYFILDRDNNVIVYVSDSSIKVSENGRPYEIPFSMSSMDGYMEKIKRKLEQVCAEIKKDMFSNEMAMLDKIKELYETEGLNETK